MIMIKYSGAIAAIVTERNVRFAPPYDERPADDPDRRFVYAMALCAHDILTGELPGPYTDEAAEEYARAFLRDPADDTVERLVDGALEDLDER